MKSYVSQLLSDIKNAHREVPPGPSYALSLEDELEEVERWLSGEEPEHPFSYFCGLEKIQFPPLDRLTKKQVKDLVRAIEDMMFSWNLDADFPKKFPPERKYPLLVDLFDRPVDIVDSGFITLEFCEYEPEKCPFGADFCHCKDLMDPLEMEPGQQEGNEKPRQLSNYVRQLLGDLRLALENLPNPGIYHLLYGEEEEDEEHSSTPLKSLSDWLGIDLAAFPPPAKLNRDELEALSDVLLSYWDPSDALIIAISNMETPSERYHWALQFLELRARYDGGGGFLFESFPEEDWEGLRDSVNRFFDNFDLSLDNFEGEGDPDNDLPF